jgi:NADH dehydrogenase
MAENHVQESKMKWIIVRLSEVYGISGEEGIEMIMNNILKMPFVPIIGNGSYRLAPVYIDDAVDSIIKVIKNTKAEGRIYNIAGPEGFSYNDFIDKVLRSKGIRRIKIHIPVSIFSFLIKILSIISRRNIITKDQVPRLLCEKSEDISLAKDELGFNPISFSEGLKKFEQFN